MGFTLHSDQLPVVKASNCLLAPSAEEMPAVDDERQCIRCGECATVCPIQLLPQQLYWYAHAKNFDKVQDYHIHDCIECGCCSHVCPSHIPLVQFYRFAKTELWKKEQEKRKADHARTRHEARVARLERLAAERKAKLRQKKEALEKPARGKGKSAAGGDDAKKAAIEAAMKRVPVDVVAENVIWGTPGTIRSALETYVDAGLRHIVVGPASAAISRRSALYSVGALFSILRRVRRSANARLVTR